MTSQDPKWLRFLSRHLSWIAIPGIAIIFVTLQAFGFFFVYVDPLWIGRLALVPELVLQGQLWRLITFIALPLSESPIWMLFALWFLYSILNSIEAEWGEFKTTFYILVSLVLTVIFSFVFGYPIVGISDFSSTIFLAAATLFPDFEIRLYMLLPIKLKYLGWLAVGFLCLRLTQGSWIDRLYLVTIYSNYLVFFGPQLFSALKQWKRRRAFRANWR